MVEINEIQVGQEVFNIGGSGGGVNYSTQEQNTGLKWIDGKDIYQKTIQVRPTTNYPANTTLSDTLYTDSSVDKVILIKGMIIFTYGDYLTRVLPFVMDTSQQYNFIPDWIQNQHKLVMTVGLKGGSSYNISDVLYEITLQYTKTTN